MGEKKQLRHDNELLNNSLSWYQSQHQTHLTYYPPGQMSGVEVFSPAPQWCFGPSGLTPPRNTAHGGYFVYHPPVVGTAI
jgi:hypothetical protein